MTDITQAAQVPIQTSDFPTRKAVSILMLLVATSIAGWLVSGVVDERAARQNETLEGFRNSWGPEQTLHGPILVIPYRRGSGDLRMYLEIAPQNLTAKTFLSPQERKRGLFHATVFNATIELQGNFTMPSKELLGADRDFIWADAFVIVNTATLSGMTSADHFTWNGEKISWQNCRELISKDDCVVSSAVVAHVPFAGSPAVGTSLPFVANLTLRGTSAFSQALQAANIDASVEGQWATPSFGGLSASR